MKKVHYTAVYIGYAVSGILAFSSYYRWFIEYLDPSQAYFGIGIALLIGAVTFVYDRQRGIADKLEAVEEYLADRK